MKRFYDSSLADTHRFWLLRPVQLKDGSTAPGVAFWTNDESWAAQWFASGRGEVIDRWMEP